MKSRRQGFTLIELLVVIAIIGLLSSIVLASLNSARNKGKDAAIMSQMAEIRSQAELFYSSNGNTYTASGTGGGEDSYGECTNSAHVKFAGTMFDDGVTGNVHDLIVSAGANRNTSYSRIYCSVTKSTWALAIPVHNPKAGTTGWCVDNTGASKAVNLDFATSNVSFTACP